MLDTTIQYEMANSNKDQVGCEGGEKKTNKIKKGTDFWWQIKIYIIIETGINFTVNFLC